MWGVSDPAARARGRMCEAAAGSLTPLPCCDTCTRALTGRHRTPPDSDDGVPAKVLPCMYLAGAYSLWVVSLEAGAAPMRR
jgi:hypothetical protein